MTGNWTLKDGYDLDICKYEEMNILVKETSISQKLCLNVILGPEMREVKERLTTGEGCTSWKAISVWLVSLNWIL